MKRKQKERPRKTHQNKSHGKKIIAQIGLLTSIIVKLCLSCTSKTQNSGMSSIRGIRYIDDGTNKHIHTIDLKGDYRKFELTTTTPASTVNLGSTIALGYVESALFLSETDSIVLTRGKIYTYSSTTGLATEKGANTCTTTARFLIECKLGRAPFFACQNDPKRLCVWSQTDYTITKSISGQKISEFSISTWPAPAVNKVYVNIKDTKEVQIHDFETTTVATIDHSSDASIVSVSSNLALHSASDVVIYAVNSTGNTRGRLLLTDRSLTTTHSTFPFSRTIIRKLRLIEASSQIVLQADKGVICIVAFPSNTFDTSNFECFRHAPPSYFDFEVFMEGGNPSIIFYDQSSLALYTKSGDLALSQIYSSQPTRVTRQAGSHKMEYHVFEGFYVKEFDTETKTYSSGEIYQENIYKSVMDQNDATKLFSLIAKTQKTFITELRISDKTLLNTFDLIAQGLVTATVTPYEDIRIVDFCFSKTNANHIFVLYIAWKTSDKQRTFFVSYHDISAAITRNTVVYTPTDDDQYTQIVHYSYQSTEKLILVGACFVSFQITYGTFAITEQSKECLLTSTDWPARSYVNTITHGSPQYDILAINSPDLLTRYNPSPTLEYHEKKESITDFTNCLPSTINDRFYCGGNLIYVHDYDTSENNEATVFFRDFLKGVIFRGFDDSEFYFQRGVELQIKIDLVNCNSGYFGRKWQAFRKKCLAANCAQCDLATGLVCVKCNAGFFFVGGVCIDTCSPNYYSNNQCVTHCPKYKFKYKNSNGYTTCVSACNNGAGVYPFGDTCHKCDGSDQENVGGKCRCRNGQVNTEGTGCAGSCSGYFYQPYDGMCISALRDDPAVLQVTGTNFYCLKTTEYYFPASKSCASACDPPNVKNEAHSEYGKACALQADGCQPMGMMLIEGTTNCVLASNCPTNLFKDSLTHKCTSSCSGDQFKDLVAKSCVTDCPNTYYKDNSTMVCVSTCPTSLSFKDNQIRSCVATCSGDQFKDIEEKTCVTECPSNYLKNPSTMICVQTCPAQLQYIDPASQTCLVACPKKFNTKKLCYDEFNITTEIEDNPLEDPAKLNSQNFDLILKISKEDQPKNMQFIKELITSVSNKEEVFLNQSVLNSTNAAQTGQFELKLTINKEQIIDKCNLTVKFNTSLEMTNPNGDLFYT